MDAIRANRCGALGLPDGSVRWRVWAPRAKKVNLILLDGERKRAVPMIAEERGYFSHAEGNVANGQRYAYRLDSGPERPDPASLWQPDGVHRASAVYRPEQFGWSDQGWAGIPRPELVFYEIHVGTFAPQGTFDAIIPRLDSLCELGITALELMPVAQFPGQRNWGYDGVHLFAAQDSYGGPQGLQRLVDACHRAGLAIFLDVVYNHLGPEGNYLHEFGPYFADRYRTFWGPAFNYDSAGCDAVRDFVLDNVRTWIGDFRLDGLRLDAVHAIYDMSIHHILADIKKAADEAAASLGRQALVIAESDQNDVRLLLPPERGGHNLDGMWNDDFHHTVHAYLTGERQGYYVDFGRIQDLPKLMQNTIVVDGVYSKHRDRRHGAPTGDLPGDRFVVSIQNHDQVGNRARGERLSRLVGGHAFAAQEGSRPLSESLIGRENMPPLRLAACLLLLAPHLPLLFMGEEYGEENPFLFFCSFSDGKLIENVRQGRRKEFAAFAWQGEVPDPQAETTFTSSCLAWSWVEGTQHAGLRLLYQDLLRARRCWPALKDYQNRSAKLLSSGGVAAVLEMVRGGRSPEADKTLQVYFNLTGEPQLVPLPAGVGVAKLFASEAPRYHGNRDESKPESRSRAREEMEMLLPYECVAFGPSAWGKLT